MKAHFLSSCRYHRWAFEVLYKALNRVSDADYRADHGLFFKSIHGTLNHLLLADRIWYSRFAGTVFAVTGLDQELETDRTQLEQALYHQGDAWLTLLEAQPETRFADMLEYCTTTGTPCRTPVDKTLMHLFNHGTHHRGQISAVISRLGLPVPEMDYLYYVRERE
ncbi:MAG: DinB family protein [Lentisphaerae bacterium]|nr:DinB family protein [Lentisphaerota bacterium]